jgi:hypothetical protein
MQLYYQQAIESASHQLAAAIAEHERANEALIAAQNGLETVEAQIAEKQAERAGIVQHRVRGDRHDNDGAMLALIEADLEGLGQILADATAAVNTVRGPAQEAQRRVGFARQQPARAEGQAKLEAFLEHAKRLDALLLETIGEISEASRVLDVRMPPWGASKALFEALNKLRIQRREA